MANRGLKDYTGMLKTELASGAGFINVNKNDANLLFLLPLFNIRHPKILNLSLVYNYQQRNETSLFGKGFKLNLYTEINMVGNHYEVKNSDGSIDSYYYDSGTTYKNEETKNTFSVLSEGGYTIYKITDKEGYFCKYNLLLSPNYPVCMGKDNEIIDVKLHENNKKILLNVNNYIIEFTIDSSFSTYNRVNKITYSSYGLNEEYDITYSSEYISEVVYKVSGNETIKTELEFYSGSIYFKDVTNKEAFQYIISYDKVSKIIHTDYPTTFPKVTETNITYYSNKTLVKDYLNNELFYFFDNYGKILYNLKRIYNDGGQTISYALNNIYYDDNKRLIHESSSIRYYPELGNLLSSKRINDFNNNSLTITGYNVYQNDYFYKYILTDTADLVSGSGYLYKMVNINGLADDNYVISVLVKLHNYNPNYNPLNLKIIYGNSERNTYLRKKVINTEYELLTIGFHLYESVTNISIYLYINDATMVIGGIQLLKKSFGINYNYDINNNVNYIETKDGKTNYQYNANNLVSKVIYPDNTFQEIEYTQIKGVYKISKTTNEYGLIEETEYDTSNGKEIIKRLKNNNYSQKILSSKVYSNSGQLIEEHDEDDNYTYYQYNSGLIDEIYYPQPKDNVSRTVDLKFRDNNNLVNKIKRQQESLLYNFNVFYSYDSSKNLHTITTGNSSVVTINYNNKNDFESLLIDNMLISKISYDEDLYFPVEIGYTNNNYQKNHLFIYDELNNYRLKNIKLKKITGDTETILNRYDFTYNTYNQLKQVYFYPNNNTVSTLLKEYYYDNNERINRITSPYLNYTYEYIYNGGDELKITKYNINSNNKYISYDVDSRLMVTSLYTINQSILNMFDIIPLNGDVTSIKGVKPVIFNYSNKPFKLNDDLQRREYYPTNGDLAYDLSFNDAGTLCANVAFSSVYSKQYIFSLKDGNNHIDVYVYNTKLHVDLLGYDINTQITAYTSHTKLAFSFTKRIVGSSSFTTYIDIRLKYGNSLYETSREIGSSFSSPIVYIGSSGIDNNYKMSGYISNIAFRPAYNELSTINTVLENLDDVVLTYRLDLFGRLSYKKITKNSNVKVSNTYSYLDRHTDNNNDNYTTHKIGTETIKYGNNQVNRVYTYDGLNRIISITDQVFGSHTYNYDYRGFLTYEKYGNNIIREYTYDNNGNILSVTNSMYPNYPETFEYDTNIKDRIKKKNNFNISYSNVTPGNIYGFQNYEYTYEGKRMVEAYYANSGEYKKVSYTYDEEGLIIKRNMYNWYDDDEDGEVEDTFYYYENGNLVCEIKDDIRNDYLYDENGNLYGFIKNNTNIYYYIRDILGTILGIVDESGNLVVKYDYDAYGNIINQIGNIYNPFRYKGYYYDDEIFMYYLKSRFYNPELRRFMTPDSYKYLEPTNVGCINLYAYCNNNPIMNYDPDGKFIVDIIGALLGKAIFKASIGISLQVLASTTVYSLIMTFPSLLAGAFNDMSSIGFNPFNTNKDAVYNSKFVSFYKGVPVFRANTERSGTFLAIFLQDNIKKDYYILEHEYGHIVQQTLLGPRNYLLGIGIPSINSEGDGIPYYNNPWEASADYFGGVSESEKHSMNPDKFRVGMMYLFFLMFFT